MSDELIGKTIGGYEILHLIGEGGMASVYLARQKSMNREVAIKVLPSQYIGDTTYLQRFEQEVKIVSKLEHRNIVPVYDYGEYQGQPYIVMRYMNGGSVDTLIQKGPITADRIVDILAQITPALDYAHDKNVLHRDLKPSNILLDDDDGAYITDFGIARILGEKTPTITTQGVVGTPSYMSPEQAQAFDLDGRSDVYSLGIMLFEMFTGHRPFQSDTPYSIAVMQVTKPPPSPRSFNANISIPIESVIYKTLKKKPEDRYPTALALSEALKLAVERPTHIHDTKPKMEGLDATSPSPPAPAPAAPYTAPKTPQSSRAVQPVNNLPSWQGAPARKSGRNVWLSIVLGGLLGCGLLTGIAVVGFFVINGFGNSTPTPDNSDGTDAFVQASPVTASSVEPLSTLDATSSAGRDSLIQRDEQADATFTAVAEETQNAPTPAIDVAPIGIRGTPTLRAALRDVSGEIIYFDRRENGTFEIMKLNLDTWAETQLTDDNSINSYPIASPDGRWIAFQSDRDGDFDIYVMNTVGGQLRKVTFNDYLDRLPAWSSDGEWIIYSSDTRDDGSLDLFRVRPDGTDNEIVLQNGSRNSHARYSQDDRFIVFTTGTNPADGRTWEIGLIDLEIGEEPTILTDNAVRDASPIFAQSADEILYVTFDEDSSAISTMSVDGTNPRIIYNGEGNDWAASYSPDGAFIVFTSDLDGDDQLYLMTKDGRNIQQITTLGGAYASWIPEIPED